MVSRALLIGIDEYFNLPDYMTLQGCSNDVRLIGEILERRFRFSTANQTLLLNKSATRDAILNAFQELLDVCTPDDNVVIHYSGHGSQRTTEFPDMEPDGLDETIMPADSGRDLPNARSTENRDITDKAINNFLLALTQKTEAVTVIFDCCHSGSGVRAVADPFPLKARSVPSDHRPVTEFAPVSLGWRNTRDATAQSPLSAANYVFLAGCRDSEFSYERKQPGGGDEVDKHGAMTYSLCQELRTVKSGTTYRDIWERIRAAVGASTDGKQHPQLEGRVDRELFGVKEVRPMNYVSVVARQGQRVELAAGEALGITVGSHYWIYPDGTHVAAPADRCAKVAITETRAAVSTGQILEEARPGVVQPLCRAVADTHVVTSAALRVAMSEDLPPALSERAQQLHCLIDDSPTLVFATATAADYRIAAIDTTQGYRWQVTTPTGGIAMPECDCDGADAARRVVDNLESWARYRRILNLHHPHPDHALNGSVSFEIDVNDQPLIADDSGAPHIRSGDIVKVKLQNNSNRPLFTYLLDLGVTGRVAVIYDCGEEALAPGRRITAVHAPLSWPPDSDFLGDCGQESVRMITCTTPLRISHIAQEPVRTGEAFHPLGAFLSATATRDLAPPPPLLADDDWTTEIRSFELHRSPEQASNQQVDS